MKTLKCCLSEETARRAWELERAGKNRAEVAMRFYVSERTLQRLYKQYNFGSPKRKKKGISNADNK